MLLSDRMQAVVELVEPCDSMADIGCDHGYVSMELIRRRICKHVIAMDINHGPLECASHNIKEYSMQDYIEIRQSDGTEALLDGEADGMICAGMGGRLIISILKRGNKLVSDMKQIVLQPQSEIAEVRSYLRQNSFLIDKEDIIFEDGKYYFMMRALPGAFGKLEKQIAGTLAQKYNKTGSHIYHRELANQPPSISELSRENAERLTRIKDTYGPYLLETAHPALKNYLLRQKANLKQIRKELVNQEKLTPRQECRVLELDEKLSDIVFCLYNYFK